VKLAEHQEGWLAYYSDVYTLALELEIELKKPSCDYQRVKQLAELIKNSSFLPVNTSRPDVDMEEYRTSLGTSWEHNVFHNLLMGITSAAGASIMFSVGLVLAIPAYLLRTPYLGSPAFLLDAVVLFAQSLLMITRVVVFPIEMLYSEYTTGSCDVLKGESVRLLESLMECCERELDSENTAGSSEQAHLNYNF